MRVSDNQRYNSVDTRINSSKSDNVKSMNEMASQKRLTKISDDPNAMSKLFGLRDRSKAMDQFQRNLDYARGFISKSEASLTGIHESLMRAKELAVGMASDTYASDSREAASREIKELISGIVAQANAKHGDRYVFSGFRTQTPSMGEDGQYLGDDGEIFLEIAPQNFQRINLTARELFETTAETRAEGHFGMIEALQLLYRGLNDNDKDSIRKAMTEMDYQMDKASSFQSTLGALTNSIDVAEKRLAVDKELILGDLSKIEDADMLDSTSRFKRSEALLQSTLMASNKMLQPSLLNFMQ